MFQSFKFWMTRDDKKKTFLIYGLCYELKQFVVSACVNTMFENRIKCISNHVKLNEITLTGIKFSSI